MAPGPVLGLMAAALTRAPGRARHRAFAIGGSIALGLFATGCSVLDEVAQHVDDVLVYMEDDEEIFGDQAAADAPYRSLGEVPDEAPTASSPEERAATASGLVADRDKAKYTHDELRNRHERTTTQTGRSDAQSEDGSESASSSPEEPPTAPMMTDEPDEPVGETSTLQRTAPTPTVEPASKAVLESRDSAASTRSTPSASTAPRDAEPIPVAAPRTTAAPTTDTIATFKSRFDERFNASGSPPRTASGGSSSASSDRPPDAAPRRADAAGDDAVASVNRSPRTLAAYDPPSIILRAGTIHFPSGSARLSQEDHATLKRVAAQRRDHGARIRVVGHSSRWTTDMPPSRNKIVNLNISLDRASAVSRALLDYGVPPEALSITATATSQPVAVEDMPRSEAKNRRVEIFIEY